MSDAFLQLLRKYKFLNTTGAVNPRFEQSVLPLLTSEETLIYENVIGTTCAEKVYCALNNINKVPCCEQCSKELTFNKQIKGYRKYCSNRCRGAGEAKKRDLIGASNPETQKKNGSN